MSVHLSTWNNSAPTGWVFMKIDIWIQQCFIMNVPILKPYISATTNPKWMKLVPRERPWPRVSYDCCLIQLLATKQTLLFVIEKIALMQHKQDFVHDYGAACISTTLRDWSTTGKEHSFWYKQFKETGCLCKGKSPGQPCTLERHVWDELSYRVDDVHVAGGGHIERL